MPQGDDTCYAVTLMLQGAHGMSAQGWAPDSTSQRPCPQGAHKSIQHTRATDGRVQSIMTPALHGTFSSPQA